MPEINALHSGLTSTPWQIAQSSLDVAVRAGYGLWFREVGGAPWSPETILGCEVWQPLGHHELAVDVSETLDIKTEALSYQRSQTATVLYDSAARGLARWRGVMSLSGGDAEVFEVS